MIRCGSVSDLELVFAIQREASIAGFGPLFELVGNPYPDDIVREELRAQLENPAISS